MHTQRPAPSPKFFLHACLWDQQTIIFIAILVSVVHKNLFIGCKKWNFLCWYSHEK